MATKYLKCAECGTTLATVTKENATDAEWETTRCGYSCSISENHTVILEEDNGNN